jgi:hypothetical protein
MFGILADPPHGSEAVRHAGGEEHSHYSGEHRTQ